MNLTSEHVAALKAMLVDDHKAAEGWFAAFDQHDNGDGLGVMITAAFNEAVHRRFGVRREVNKVIQFVARVRAGSGPYADELDPSIAERLIWGALGDESAFVGMTEDEKSIQVPLLMELVSDEELDEAELTHFLECARERAERIAELINR